MPRESKKARLDMATVCVVGSGARELAIIRALKRSSRCSAVRCFGAEPNDAIAELAGAIEIGDEASPAAVLAFCKSGKADLVIIGPAAALAAGVVDMLLENGIQAVGARQAAAAVANKDFARNLMKQVLLPQLSKPTIYAVSSLFMMLALLHVCVRLKSRGSNS